MFCDGRARRTRKKYGVDEDELREVLARIAWKNHYNGARNPRAQFRKEMSVETICNAPPMAGRLGVFDCAGVADGSAAAIVVRAEDAHRYTDKPLYIKALSFVAGNGSGLTDPDVRLHDASPRSRRRAPTTPTRRPASPTRASELAMAEVHDCFTPDRARAHGGPRVRRAGHGVEGSARRHVRPRRRAAGQPRRRAEELRPPGRRVGPAHDVRGVAAAARRGARRARHPRTTASSPSPTTSAATPARWSASSASSAPSPPPDPPQNQMFCGKGRYAATSGA